MSRNDQNRRAAGSEGGAAASARGAAGPLPGEAASVPGGTLSPTEMQYHLFVERVRDYAIFLIDADGIITHWGEGAERMKGFTPEEVVGQHLRMLYPEGGSEDGTADEHIRLAAEHGEYIGEGMRVHRDRGLFPARVCLTSLWRDGRLYGFSKVSQDLTEQRAVEERLERALRAAESASVEKSRFLATMSHEVRTPINAVLGYAEILDLEIAGPLTDRQRSHLDRLRASGRHLLALIEDVLDFSRLEAGRLPLRGESGRTAELVEQALSLLRPGAEARGLRLESECDSAAEYWGDPVRVRQILVNLLGNAVKFTHQGGLVRVACGSEGEPDGGDLVGPGPWSWVRVEDTGIGIPEDRLEDVFHPFVQVESTLTREHEGSGLGLSISRRLARLQGGDLTVQSRPGQGSVFTLWLPAAEHAVPAEPREAEGREAESLSAMGQRLSSAAYAITRSVTHRLRVDPVTRDAARDLTRSELEDHTPTFLTDITQFLVMLGEDGPDVAQIIRDGNDLQTMLAERHGRQRHRVGFSEVGLVREYEILLEELEAVVRQAGQTLAGAAAAESLAVLRRVVTRAAEVARGAYQRAAGTRE